MTSQRRWLIYGLIGFMFGIADWFYLDGLAHFPWGVSQNTIYMVPVILALNYGIWLLPVLPITFYESRISHLARWSALAGAVCWSSSILSYYLFYTLLLAFWGLPNMEHLLVFGARQAGFEQEWAKAFQKIILDQVLEWLPIALVGGSIVGLIVWWLSHYMHRTRTALNRPGQNAGN